MRLVPAPDGNSSCACKAASIVRGDRLRDAVRHEDNVTGLSSRWEILQEYLIERNRRLLRRSAAIYFLNAARASVGQILGEIAATR
jgi:hypothetical protein